MLENLNKYKIILASQSPRRRDLLSQMQIQFEVRISNFDETSVSGRSPKAIAELIAKGKAEAMKPVQKENELIITADTIVVLNDNVIGKPKDSSEAKIMLHSLSGKSHDVITSVCIQTVNRTDIFSVTTEVHIKQLNDSEIDYYVQTYSPLDKAGAYGIQEWLGIIAVESLSGSYHNVMGLPTQELYKQLQSF